MTMRRLRRQLKDQRGFTVVELIIASGLLLVVMFAAYTFYESMTSSASYVDSASQANSDARTAMDVISRALRQSTEIATNGGAIFEAGPRRCGMYVDIDKDGAIEKVRYWAVGQTIYWSKQEPDVGSDPPTYSTPATEHTLIRSADGGWNGNIFNYYAVGDPPTSVSAGHPEDVAAVEIELRTRGGQSGTGQSAGSRLTTWVRIRSVFNALD